MNYRLSVLHEEEEYSADKVETVDLDIIDPISQLILFFKVHNNAGNTAPTAHLVKGLSKIEIIDGSDVLYSLDGYEAQAVDYYEHGHLRSPWNAYLNGNYGDIQVGINFGRHLWDRDLAFDATKFNNPQLKVTMDIDAGGVSADKVKLKVLGAIFDERKISPTGFLMHKEIKDYVMAASAHEPTIMPTDYPYRKMFVKCLTAGTEPGQLLSTIKLTEETDKKIPFNTIGMGDILRTIQQRYPPIEEHIFQWCGTSQTYGYCVPTARVAGVASKWADAAAGEPISYYDGDGGRYKIRTDTGVKNVNVVVHGYLPHGVWEIPFGDPLDKDDWYDVTTVKSLKTDLVAGSGASASNTAQIFLQQLRLY